MNVKFVFRIVSLTLLITSVFMIVPAGIAIYDNQLRNAFAYIITTILMLLVGGTMYIATKKHKPSVYAQEGVAATSLSWLSISLFGALPFFWSGEIPNYIDALFEIVSGFTTIQPSMNSFFSLFFMF